MSNQFHTIPPVPMCPGHPNVPLERVTILGIELWMCPHADHMIDSEATEPRLLAYFTKHPGELSRIDHALRTRKITSQLEDPPTEVLPPPTKDFSALIGDDDETWRTEAQPHRKRITLRHRLRRMFIRK